MQESHQKFLEKFPLTETGKPLAPFDSMGIGGPADLFFRVNDTAEIETVIKAAQENKIPYIVLGAGSNLVFADEGFRGLVIKMGARKIALESDEIISAEAGALLSQVIQFAIKNGLSGMERLMGLPGTVGGATRGNAGAYGTETKDVFLKATLYNSQKGLFEADAKYLNFGYRTSSVKTSKDIIVKVFLKFKKDAALAATAKAEAMDILKNRISKQPKGKCSGSFFKNPGDTPELKAGYMLEQCGCKGLQVGEAKVAMEHANWIMNLGAATQKDVLALSSIMQEKVKSKFNVSLEREVQFMTADGFLLPSM